MLPLLVQGKEEHTRGSCEKAPGASLGTVEMRTEDTGVAGASISETAEAAGTASAGHGSPRMEFYLVERERLDHAREAFLSKPLRCLPCSALAQQGYTAVTPTELDGVVVPLVAFDDAATVSAMAEATTIGCSRASAGRRRRGHCLRRAARAVHSYRAA